MTSHSFVLDKDTVQSFRAAWRSYSQQGAASAGDHLLQALLLGNDPLRAFSPVSNASKLANGQAPHFGLLMALASISHGTTPRAQLARIAPALRDDLAAANALQAGLTTLTLALSAKGAK